MVVINVESYSATLLYDQKRVLALVHFQRHFRYYLLLRKFTMQTDHAPLKWLRNFKDADRMLARWSIECHECYDYVIEHRPQAPNTETQMLLSMLTCKRYDCPDCADSKQMNNI